VIGGVTHWQNGILVGGCMLGVQFGGGTAGDVLEVAFSVEARMAGGMIAALRMTGCVAVVVLLMGGCQKNAVTGRSQLIFGISPSDEIALGTSAMPDLVREMGGPVGDAQLREYVASVGRSLAVHTEGDYPRYPWEFTFLDTPQINAFALPGGKVFIARGLAEKMTNEAQLAGVLGHEIGHVTARHTAERISQANVFNMGTQIGGALLGGASAEIQQLGGVALKLGGQIVPLKFSRDQELEADDLGLRYMTRAGYNPVGQLQVMQILARESGQRQVELLATHPDPNRRAEIIAKKLNGEYKQFTSSANHQLHEQRFAGFLAKVAQLPKGTRPTPRAGLDEGVKEGRRGVVNHPAVVTREHAHERGRGGVEARAQVEIDWNDPMTWCLTCQGGGQTQVEVVEDAMK
jgi:predicted Zn-dependent protease